MSKCKFLFKPMILSFLALSVSMTVMAQDPDNPGDGDPNIGDPGLPPTGPDGLPDDPDAEIPFDGGLSMLLAAGAVYGTKKAVDYRRAMRVSRDNA